MTLAEAWRVFADFWGAERYTQHSICLTNDPVIMSMYVAADMTIGISYKVIGLSLILKNKVKMELNSRAIAMYGSFILLCSFTHDTDVLLLFQGLYRLDILIRVATAAVSAVTAVYTLTALWGQVRAAA